MTIKILEKNGVDNTNINGASFNKFATNGKNGIISGILNEFTFSAPSSNVVSFASGELLISGFRINIDDTTDFTITATPSVITNYSIIGKIVVDSLSNVTFSTVMQLTSVALTQDSLFGTTTGEGTYELRLGTFDVNTSGEVENLVQVVEKIVISVSKIETPDGSSYIEAGGNFDNTVSLTVGAESETGILKFFRNYFKLYAERIHTSPNLKYKYLIETQTDGSIKVAVEDTETATIKEYYFGLGLIKNSSDIATLLDALTIHTQLTQDITGLLFTCNEDITSLTDGRNIYIKLPDTLIIEDGGVTLSIDNGVTYKNVCFSDGNQLNLYNLPVIGTYYLFVFNATADCWVFVRSDADFVTVTGSGWTGQSITSNYNTNVVQQDQIANNTAAIASLGALAKQSIDITTPTTLSSTETTLDFDFVHSYSNEETILSLGGITAEITTGAGLSNLELDKEMFKNEIAVAGTNLFIYSGTSWQLNSVDVLLATYGLSVDGIPILNDTITVIDTGKYTHILNSTNEAGFIVALSSSVQNLNNGQVAEVAIRLYADGVLKDTAYREIGRGLTGSITKDTVVVVDEIPKTLTVTGQVISGNAQVVFARVTSITNFSTGSSTPVPEQTATLTVAGWSGGTTQTISGLTLSANDSANWTWATDADRTLVAESDVRAVTTNGTDGEIDFLCTTTPTSDINIVVKRWL